MAGRHHVSRPSLGAKGVHRQACLGVVGHRGHPWPGLGFCADMRRPAAPEAEAPRVFSMPALQLCASLVSATVAFALECKARPRKAS